MVQTSLLDTSWRTPHNVKTNVPLTNKNNTRNVAMQMRLSSADMPMKKVAAGFTDVDIIFQFPSQKNL